MITRIFMKDNKTITVKEIQKELYEVTDASERHDQMLIGLEFTRRAFIMGGWLESLYTSLIKTIPIINNQCTHEPKLYIGFIEQFNYCIKCNEKLAS